jgi:DNA-binding CsgD family transcriptional regulator
MRDEELRAKYPSLNWGEEEWFIALSVDDDLYNNILKGIARVGKQPAARRAPGPQLSPREHAVLNLIGRGLTYEQAARQLYVSINTIKSHLYRARDRFGVSSTQHLLAICYERGLLERPSSTEWKK